MTELMRLIQGHLDKYGVTRAEFARRAGTTPQTVQNWKDRPTTLPRREHLEGVAQVIGVPYEVVLSAALKDAGYQDHDDLPLAARATDPRYGKGRAEQGEADGEESQEGYPE